jgi:hypothetical protein
VVMRRIVLRSPAWRPELLLDDLDRLVHLRRHALSGAVRPIDGGEVVAKPEERIGVKPTLSTYNKKNECRLQSI